MPRSTNPKFIQDTIRIREQDIENALLAEIEDKTAPLLAQYPNNRSLWKALERTATAVLRTAKERNLILNYHVRCDEETASWGTPTSPVVEILLRFPRRVQHFQLQTGCID